MANTPKNGAQRYIPDSIFKWIMTLRFTRLGIPLQTQVEVGYRPRSIDAVFVLSNETELEKVKAGIGFDHAGEHNLVEFKSEKDPLTTSDLWCIVGRLGFYICQNNISARNLTATVVCARTPQKVLRHPQADLKFESIGGGYYRSTGELPIHIIAVNELEVIPKNYPLLMFATSKRKFKEFLHDALARDDSDDRPIITCTYVLRAELIQELNMSIKNHLSPEALDFIIENIGDEILDRFSPEEIASRLSPEERITGLSPEEIASRLSPEERITGLSPEEIASRLSPEERITGLSPEERITGLSLEERIRGLTPEERRQLQQLLEQ